MPRRLAALLPAAGLVLSGTPSYAERADTVVTARAAIRSECPIASGQSTAKEETDASRETLGLALAMIGANIAGSLATSGMNAIGNAIEQASAEHGFVAEGATTFRFYDLRHPEDGEKLAKLEQPKSCLILFLPQDSTAPKSGKKSVPPPAGPHDEEVLKQLNAQAPDAGLRLRPFTGDPATVLTTWKNIGVGTAPKVYVEAVLIPAEDGMIVRPVFAWYRDRILSKAPSEEAATELHVTFAVPSAAQGASDIGAPFASTIIPLPRMTPGSARGSWELAGRKFVVIPARPTTGAPDGALADTNALYTTVATLAGEHRALIHAADLAKRRADRTKKDEDRWAQQDTEKLRDEKLADLNKAKTAVSDLRSSDDKTPRTFGATNVKARFVVIREEKAFGMAVAAALKGQADEMGAAVKDAIAPKPDWTAADTALVAAVTSVAAKQRQLDATLASGDTAAAALLSDELVVLKARANEAAVAVGQKPPYPNLLP